MNTDNGLIYLTGLVIVSLAIGFRTEATTGWLIFGGGILIASIFGTLVTYLTPRSRR